MQPIMPCKERTTGGRGLPPQWAELRTGSSKQTHTKTQAKCFISFLCFLWLLLKECNKIEAGKFVAAFRGQTNLYEPSVRIS